MISLSQHLDPVWEVRLYRIGWRITRNSDVILSVRMVRHSVVFSDRGQVGPACDSLLRLEIYEQQRSRTNRLHTGTERPRNRNRYRPAA